LFIGHLIAIRHSRLIMGMLLILLVFAGVQGFVATPEATEYPLVVRSIAAIIWIILALVFFGIIQLITVAIIAYGREHKGLLGVHTLVLTQEGLIERTDYNETLHRWKGFHRIRETSRYLYLYVSEVLYHQIPKRSFTSGEEMRSFLDEIKSRTNAA